MVGLEVVLLEEAETAAADRFCPDPLLQCCVMRRWLQLWPGRRREEDSADLDRLGSKELKTKNKIHFRRNVGNHKITVGNQFTMDKKFLRAGERMNSIKPTKLSNQVDLLS